MVKVSLKYSARIAAAAVIFSGVAVAQTQPGPPTPFSITVCGTVKPAYFGDQVAQKNKCGGIFECATLQSNTVLALVPAWEKKCAEEFKRQAGYDATKGNVYCAITEMSGGTCKASWITTEQKCEVTITDRDGKCSCEQIPPPGNNSGNNGGSGNTGGNNGGSGSGSGGGGNNGGQEDVIALEAFVNSILGADHTLSEPLE